jgi:hypothetical protein
MAKATVKMNAKTRSISSGFSQAKATVKIKAKPYPFHGNETAVKIK